MPAVTATAATTNRPAEPTAARGRRHGGRRRARRHPRRFLRRAGVLLLVTWIPAALGGLGVAPLGAWAVASGYLGVNWLLPGVLVGAAAREYAACRGFRYSRAAGLAAATLSAVCLLLVAGTLIGT